MSVKCPTEKPAGAKCFGTQNMVSSNNTNLLDVVTNKLPTDAAMASPILNADVLVTYYQKDPNTSGAASNQATRGLTILMGAVSAFLFVSL